MEQLERFIPFLRSESRVMESLRDCNSLSARYGLVLSRAEMLALAERQEEALRDTGRIEFGAGPYGKLIYAFCDSPYLSQAEYAGTLAELCALFYRFKGESGERWSDDELIGEMKRLYDGPCHGSPGLVGDRLWQALHSAPEEDTEGEAPVEAN